MDTVIEISDLGKRYPGAANWALKDVSLAFRRGEVYGLVGENGAGKTTLIRLILGLIRPTTGQVKFPKDLRIGYVPEKPAFYTTFKVREYLTLIGRTVGLNGIKLKNSVDEVLQVVDLVGKADAKINTLSRGMLQRLGIAQAILGDSDFIVMDEPAAGLDPLGQRGIRDLIMHIHQQEKSILFSSHYLVEIERVCDRVGFIHKGQLVLDRNLEELIRSHREKVEIEVDRETTVLENAFCGWNLRFEVEGRKVLVFDLDDDHYFAMMRLLNEHGIRLLALKHSGFLLEEIFLQATSQRREDQ
ncbi:hypothetical protein SY88_22770 [Clostridiales bacterium PH28_bin88]|nr:hypothetical protein SY88_22770 [Clostridiales bacterium PH28_bin88]